MNNAKKRRCTTCHGWKPIHYASHRGDVALLHNILFRRDATVEDVFIGTTRTQSTPLHVAAVSGHADCVDMIVTYMAQHIPDAVVRRRLLTQQCSPMRCQRHWIVPREEDFVESFGPNDMIMSSKRTGFQPLDLAVLSNAPGIVSCLLTAIHDTCPPQDKFSPHAIHSVIASDLMPAAIARGSRRIVEELIHHGASMEAVCVDEDAGMRPIHWAAAYGDAAILSLLVQRGADPLSTTQYSNESLRDVAERCCSNVTQDFVRLVEETQRMPEL